MSTPRPATRLNSSSRPLSAIFVGKIDVNKEPTSTERTLQLPSPPHTNSNDGGSTGDSGTVGRKGLSPTRRISPDMSHRDERGKRPASRSTYYDDEDELDEVHDLPNEYDEDHTARMSDDRRSTGTGSSGSAISRSSGNSSGALSRARTLADRNRRVLDKLAAITTGSRTTRLASISRHHKPLTQELSAPTTHTSREGGVSPSPSRLSLSHSRSDKELVSGSDTEKERMSSDDHSITPTTGPSRLSEGKESVRRHVDSDPSSSETHSSTIRRSLDLHHEHSSNSKPLPRDTEAEGEESQVTSSFNTSRNKRNSRRAPLPSSFRDSSHSHAETSFGSTSRSVSPEISKLDRRSNPPSTYFQTKPDSPTNFFRDPSPVTSRTDRNTRRFSTVREPGTRNARTHGRYGSDASSSTDMSSRYQRRGGSAESAIIPSSGRSLIGETLKSAGLSPRKEKAEVPPFSPRKATRASMPNGIPGAATLREAYRSPNVEEGRGQERTRRSTLEPGSTSRPSSSGAGKALEVTSRTPFQFSRPSTSAGFYTRDGINRTAPLQRGSPARGSPSKHVNGRDLMSPTPSRTPFSARTLAPPSPSPARIMDHPDILIDALSMLEGHMSRLPSSSSAQASDCLRSAQTLVDATRALNAKLRDATNSAIEQHVEAEVEGTAIDGELLAAELWKSVGAEFRENLRMSDELIRSLTVFFLSFGKILRDNISTHTRTGSVGSNEDAGRSSRLSLEGVRRLPDADSRDAVDEWGRRNAGGRGSDSGRRSLESPARRLELGMESYPRSSTSMSRTRAGSPVQRPGTASPDPSHSRKSGVFSAFSSTSRRFFTSRKGIQSPSIGNPTFSVESSTYESPTPARHVDPERMPGRSSLDYERSTLPSESSQNRSPERNRLRKNKTSTTSNATVRGSSILPSVSTALPAQVTITPAINSPEEFDLRSGSLSKAPATSSDDDYNTHPHYVHQERAQRKRTISITSDMDEDPSSTPINTTTTRVDMRGLRPRQSPNTPVTTGRDRERRRTLTGLFS